MAHINAIAATPAQKVVVVNGSADVLGMLETVLDAGRYDMVFVESGNRAYSQIKKVQPQLVMLQKTLLNIEGLGRELDPELDLWATAKPYLERWMREQVGWRGFMRTLREEAPFWAATLPQLPRLAHRTLAEDRLGRLHDAVQRLADEHARRNELLVGLLLVAALAVVVFAFTAL